MYAGRGRCARQREAVCCYLGRRGSLLRLDARAREIRSGASPGRKDEIIIAVSSSFPSSDLSVRGCLLASLLFRTHAVRRVSSCSLKMKLVDKIAQHDGRTMFYSFEFFPPKTDQVKTRF